MCRCEELTQHTECCGLSSIVDSQWRNAIFESVNTFELKVRDFGNDGVNVK